MPGRLSAKMPVIASLATNVVVICGLVYSLIRQTTGADGEADLTPYPIFIMEKERDSPSLPPSLKGRGKG
jgi:hypothetical protein